MMAAAANTNTTTSSMQHQLLVLSTTTLTEEWANSVTHFAGLLLCVEGVRLLTRMGRMARHWQHILGSIVFALCSIFIYASSLSYHLSGLLYEELHPLRRALRVLDHCAIYFMIAGTYTPLVLMNMHYLHKQDSHVVHAGNVMLTVVWVCCCVGVGSKILGFTVPFGVDVVAYLAMGWIAIAYIGLVIRTLHPKTRDLVLLGGFCYCIGIVFLMWEDLWLNHALWHLAVVGGSVSHFLAVIATAFPGHAREKGVVSLLFSLGARNYQDFLIFEPMFAAKASLKMKTR